MLNFTSPAREGRPIQFALDGETYMFDPPKAAILVESLRADADPTAQLSAIMSWLGNGLSPDHEPDVATEGHQEAVPGCQACHLEARLRSPKDPLDLDTLAEVAKGLVEEAARRPPTSGGDSPPSPRVASMSSTAGAPLTGSTLLTYPSAASGASSTTGPPTEPHGKTGTSSTVT